MLKKFLFLLFILALVGAYFGAAYDAQKYRMKRIRMEFSAGILDDKQYAQALKDLTYLEMVYRPKEVYAHGKKFVSLDNFGF